MGKKLKNVMLHMMAAMMSTALVLGNGFTVFAEESEGKIIEAEMSDAEMTANSEKLVSQKAPAKKLNSMTLNKTDVLQTLVGAERLFYNGEFAGKFVVNTEPYLEIYAQADTASEVEGKIYPASSGTVEEWGPEWTKISSGNVTGYLPTKEIHTGYDAHKMAETIGKHIVTVTADSLNIRQEANGDSAVVATAIEDETFLVLETGEEWIQIDYGYGEGFVSAEFIDERIELGSAVSTEEELSVEESVSTEEETESETAANEEISETEAEASDSGEQENPGTSSSEPVYATTDEAYLLACMVYVESGAESYEGQLAVANVIMNRVRHENFDDTIAGVIYAPGQFPGAHNGVLDNVLATGPSDSCMQAAQEALAGVNNIGDYLYFNGYVDTSTVGSYTVIGGHTFYNY